MLGHDPLFFVSWQMMGMKRGLKVFWMIMRMQMRPLVAITCTVHSRVVLTSLAQLKIGRRHYLGTVLYEVDERGEEELEESVHLQKQEFLLGFI